MAKLNVQLKQNNKLPCIHENVLNVNQIGLKQLDVIMYNAKFVIINFAINVEELIVEQRYALEINDSSSFYQYRYMMYPVNLQE